MSGGLRTSGTAVRGGRSMALEAWSTRRTVILTGASRGIGHATVKRFAHAGWRVITCSRQPFAEACPWEAGPDDHIVLDLGDRHSLTAGLAKKEECRAGAAP